MYVCCVAVFKAVSFRLRRHWMSRQLAALRRSRYWPSRIVLLWNLMES